MSKEGAGELDAQFLDDFFGEADEHLVGMRQALLQLEKSVDKAQVEPKAIEDFFLHIHSFKGIAAIVGLGPAEAVAHATEDFLRLMRGGKAPLTMMGLEVLAASSQKMEQIVAAFRVHKPLPGIDSLLVQLQQQCRNSAPPAGARIAPRSVVAKPTEPELLIAMEEARAKGMLLWHYTFSPSHELDAHGANLNSIREELASIGEILDATSVVKGQGNLSFEFLVASRETPADIANWEAKGVTVQPAERGDPASPSQAAAASIPDEGDHNPFLAPSHVVRVDLQRLDDLMRITGEMVIHRSRLENELARLQGSTRQDPGYLQGLKEVSAGLARSLRELREGIMGVRLVSVAEVFARMPFVVRDLERQNQKRVRLKLSGQETAIDKYLIERLKDPLLHLVRNAFSHGVESVEERTASGKPAEATIELSAATVGDSVLIRVRDDGRGINPGAILERARHLGLPLPEVVDPESLLTILATPGFSTRVNADRASGRGVGMAVVYATVRELGGTLTLESEEGRGAEFAIRLPLTLAIAETFIISAAGQTCAVPQNLVREILMTRAEEIQRVNSIEVIPYQSGVLPVLRLASLFNLAGGSPAKSYLLVIESERGSVGLLADKILGQREVVVRALRDPLIQVRGISGATELGDGKPVLILDGAALTAGSVRPPDRMRSGTGPGRLALN